MYKSPAEIIAELPYSNLAVKKYLKPDFDKRCLKCLDIIKSYNLPFYEIGVFGSYARGDYKGGSDIDFYMIVDEHPDRSISGEMRQDLEDAGADLVYIYKDKHSDSLFYRNWERDKVRLL